MNILFLSDNFPPETNAPAIRTFEHCREWVKEGHEVTVITCAPNFPNGILFDNYKNKLSQTEVIDGIRVIRVWSYMTANKGFLKRSFDYFSYAVMAGLRGLFVKTDIIVATSPQFFTINTGYVLSVLKRKPWILEVRDLWPESIKAVGAIQSDKTIQFLERIELFLYRRATHIVVVTDSFRKSIAARGITTDKIHVIKNGILLDKFQPSQKKPNLRETLEIKEDTLIVGYIGTHGLAHALDFIIQTVATIDENIVFLFIGNGAAKESLVNLKNSLQVQKIMMLDAVPQQEIVHYWHLLDIALVNLKKSDTFKTVIPSKLFEAAACQKPILLGVEGEAKELVEQYTAGLCFEPENPADFVEKLKQLTYDKELYDICKQGCETMAKQFDRRDLARKLLTIITQDKIHGE